VTVIIISVDIFFKTSKCHIG